MCPAIAMNHHGHLQADDPKNNEARAYLTKAKDLEKLSQCKKKQGRVALVLFLGRFPSYLLFFSSHFLPFGAQEQKLQNQSAYDHFAPTAQEGTSEEQRRSLQRNDGYGTPSIDGESGKQAWTIDNQVHVNIKSHEIIH